MGKYAVINPATGETEKNFDADLRRGAAGGDGGGFGRAPGLGDEDDGCRARGAGQEGCRASRRAARGPGRDRRPRDGQADGAGPRRGGLLRRHLWLLRRQRRGDPRGREDRPPSGRRHGADPPDLGRPAPGDHALELPLLPGGPLRRAEPRRGQHDPAEACAPMPRVGGGDPADLQGRRLPRWRIPDHPRLERPDREGHRGPTGPGRLADGLRASRSRGRGDRGPQPEEGRPRARRFRSVRPPGRRRPG